MSQFCENVWTDGRMDRQMDGRKDGRTDYFIRPFRLRLGVQKVISITMAAAQVAENHRDE